MNDSTRLPETRRDDLPREIIDGMISAKNLGSGLSNESQVYLGMMDFTFHTDPDGEVDTNAVRKEVYEVTRVFEPIDNIWNQGSFGHLVGYEAGYYGYLWSKVFGDDMYSRFQDKGVLNEKVGGEYRRVILEQGGSKDADQLLQEFLGREPNNEAFLRNLGIDKQ